ncbi:unnamed protein product [Urochloa decumbens]|uniref:MADS-box domain-containing protein n=1 Tax=Urochloa decumbens TaxID=240449 RepID=A0ABC8ZJF2_9POAL
MPRRGRKSGMRFIEDDRDRSLTFFKRRSGLFKAASDLSTLTGARVAMVLESENERFSSFGTPDAIPIVDAFLSGDVPTEYNTSEEQKTEVTNFQNEVFQLEKYKAVAEKRKKENTVRIKDIQGTSRVGKYAYGKDEDLDATELYEMLCKLSRVKQVIDGRFPTLLHHNHVEVVGMLRDPSLLQPTWWRSMPSRVATPPNYSPLSSSLPSFQHQPCSSSSSHPVLARSGSMLPNSVMLPSQHIQPKLQQHPMGPCGPSFMQNQAPPPKEYSPHNYHMHEIDINGNNSSPFSVSPILPSPGAQPSPLQTPPANGSSSLSVSLQFSYPLHLDYQQLSFNTEDCESMQPSQNYANVDSTTFHSHQPLHDSSLGLDIDLENTSGNIGQNGGGHNLQGLPMALKGNKWEGLMHESSTTRERSPSGDTRSNLDDLNFPWY